MNMMTNFFIFRDRHLVLAAQARAVLCTCLAHIGLNASLYDRHSFRIGRALDMLNKFHYSIDEVQEGRSLEIFMCLQIHQILMFLLTVQRYYW